MFGRQRRAPSYDEDFFLASYLHSMSDVEFSTSIMCSSFNAA